MGTKTQKLSNVVDQIVEWQSVFTGDGSTGLTAVAGRGYFIDTTSGTVTVTLPASPKIGDTITIADYATTFATNNVTINPNGNKIEASTENGLLSTNDQTHTLVFTDSTQGWKIVNQDQSSAIQPQFTSATGGTITTSGDYKIHTFTGDGCFVVSNIGNNPSFPTGGPNTVDYLVVAGGGGGGTIHGAGGGAGGFRESHSTPVSGCYSASPLATPTAIPVSTTTYPITVGGGGAAGTATGGSTGSNSVFSTITSAGGGGGAKGCSPSTFDGGPGGSGGGSATGIPATASGTAGSGNTPPVSPPQGNNGGVGSSDATLYRSGGGGGGATAVGTSTPNPTESANPGGTGATTSISGTSTSYAGGGGGGSTNPCGTGTGGTGGGGNGGYNGNPSPTRAGTGNTGGGGGGSGGTGPDVAGSGGKGIVIIRYKFQ